MPICPKCGMRYDDQDIFCRVDGTKLVSTEQLIHTCPKCGIKYHDGAMFCKIDGEKLFSSINLPSSNFSIDKEINKNITAGLKQCPNCGKFDSYKAYIEDGGMGYWCPHCKKSIKDKIPQINKLISGNYEVIHGIKTTNTPCLWVSMDYWNIFFYNDGVVALRCSRGWFGLIGFIIGLFLYLVPSIVLSALGILYDKSRGESKCRLMKDRITQILSAKNGKKYKFITASYTNLSKINSSDLCLGNIWLKYRIILSDKVIILRNQNTIKWNH